MLNLLFFVFLNLMLLFSARLVLNFLIGETRSKIKVLLGTATLFFSFIVVIEILLGVFGVLTYSALSLAVILFSSGIAYHQRKEIPKIFRVGVDEKLSESDFYLIAALFAPALTLLSFRFFDALFQIPFDFDAISYHLPIVAQWMQSSSILSPYYSAFTGPVGHYPSNVELLYLWHMLPFSNDYFVDLINFPIYGLFVAGIYGVCRNFLFEKRDSLIAAGIALYIPLFMHQAGLIFVDLFFIMSLVFGIFFLQEIFKHKNVLANKILAGLILGLFLGTKYLGVVYIALPVLIFIWINRSSSKPWKGAAGFFGGIFTTGAYFYLRNWFESGNPIYPQEVTVAGLSIFPGYSDGKDVIAGSSIWDHLFEIDTYTQFAKDFLLIGNFPGVLIILGLVCSFFYVIFRVLKRDKLQKLWLPILLLVSALFYLLAYIKAPYSYSHMLYNVRYAMPLMAVGILNWGYLVKISGQYKKFLFLLLLLAITRSFIYSIYSPDFKLLLNFEILSLYRPYLFIFLGSLLFAFGLYPLLKNRLTKVLVSVLSILMFAYVISFTYVQQNELVGYYSDRWYSEDNMFWGDIQATLWFDENAYDANIAYTGTDFHYYLFGRDLNRKVGYVNVNNCLDCSFSDYDGSIRINANSEDWLENLYALEKDYLVLRDTAEEYQWVVEMPEKFEYVESFDRTYIFKIKRST